MRSPVVFSLFAVSALSPSIVYGSPVSNGVTPHTGALNDHHRAPNGIAARGLGFLNEVFARADSTRPSHPAPTSKPKVASIAGVDVGPREFWKRSPTYDLRAEHTESAESPSGFGGSTMRHKRLDDTQTTGGNAHSGTSGAVDGGSVNSGDNGGMPTLMNLNSNNAGAGGSSSAGNVGAGEGATGGNASSGDSGTAKGGEVQGSGGMVNVDSNNAGSAGKSSSGCAEAGNSSDATDSHEVCNTKNFDNETPVKPFKVKDTE